MTRFGIADPEIITQRWTPGKLMLFAEAIRQSQGREMADRMDADFIAGAAAQGSKQAFGELQRLTKRLRGETDSQGGMSVEQFTEQMSKLLGKGAPKAGPRGQAP